MLKLKKLPRKWNKQNKSELTVDFTENIIYQNYFRK